MKGSRRISAASSAIALAATATLPMPMVVAFVPPSPMISSLASTTSSLTAAQQIQEDLTFTPPDTFNVGEITEQACTDAASKMKRVMVPVSTDVSNSGYVGISFIHWEADEAASRNKRTLPLLLVHGFDSSSLEYRRLGPQLSAMGIDVYAVDLLGWGYTQLDNVNSFSAKAKVEALRGFWQAVGGNGEVVVGGASLGGAAVIEFASENLCEVDGEEECARGFIRGMVLLDAQGFVDGIGPMSFLPSPLARAGIKVLQSVPLRNSANQMSYFDPETYATEDALRVGRLHCLRDGWEDGMLSFMQSGGFRPMQKVSKIDVPSLVLWGREDGILDGKEFANKFIETLPNARLQWIEECGHVPHLEQPAVTAKVISEFLSGEEMRPLGSTKVGQNGIFDGLFSFLN